MIRTLLASLFLLFSPLLRADDKSFVVVVSSYNSADWVKKNLDSVLSQSYTQFRVIYIDDGSTDQTSEYVLSYIQKNTLEKRITFLCNETSLGLRSNLFHALQQCAPEEIVVLLDGTDWLSHHHVLAQLNTLYSNPDVWLTYGQFISYPSYRLGACKPFAEEVTAANAFRTHLQTDTLITSFYAGLFHQIRFEDLLDKHLLSFSAARLATVVPLLELSGSHSRFLSEVSYVRNTAQITQPEEEIIQIAQLLNTQNKYSPLAVLFPQKPLKKVYITPGLWGQLFAIDNPIFNRDGTLDVLCKLRAEAKEKGYEILQADSIDSLGDFEYLVVFEIFPQQLPALSQYPKEKLVLFLWEPPSVLPENYNLANHFLFSKVYTWHDGLVDNKKYFKFYYPVMKPMISDPIDFSAKRLCTLIACNKDSLYPGELYSERRNLIYFFEGLESNDFSLFGKWWPPSLKNYRGAIDKKVDTLKFFRFCYAYENIRNIPGYVTEKIFDCFHAGTVPVYWGAPNIDNTIPKNCYISREEFPDNASLYSYLKSIDEATHRKYLQNIQEFLSSPQAQLYSKEHFISLFLDMISTPPIQEIP